MNELNGSKDVIKMTGHITTQRMVIMGMMIAMAAVLAQFPLFGSIGLDALPAFFTAALLGPVLGGIVGVIAHLLIAAFTGFPFTLPLHLIVAAMMFVSCYAYGVIRVKHNRYVAIIVAIVLNGPISLGLVALVAQWMKAPFSGLPMFMALIIPLFIGAAINVVMADVIYGMIKERIKIV
jgi:uncharacterized membrane protein